MRDHATLDPFWITSVVQFPLTHNLVAQRYDSCTDYNDPDGKKWCSTKTSNSTLTLHIHVGRKGFWGYCEDDCLERDVGSCSDYADRGFKCVPADKGCKSEFLRCAETSRVTMVASNQDLLITIWLLRSLPWCAWGLGSWNSETSCRPVGQVCGT